MKYFLFLLCIPYILFSQSDVQIGLLPKINISSKINPKLKWVNSFEAREIVYNNGFSLEHSLIDISTALGYKTNLNQSATFGYIFRFEKGETIHRTFQHYNFIQKVNSLKFGHRIGFEQHFPKKETAFFRLRYRITAQKPLNGERVDKKEFYLKIGNEYVWNISSENLEVRLSPYLGYKIDTNNKLEIGTEYRVNNFLEALNKHRFWLRTTWYINL